MMVYATARLRAIAWLLDVVIFIAILIAVNVMLDMAFDRSFGGTAMLAVFVLYFAGTTASPWQGTPGKRLAGIKVADVSGARIGIVRAVLRLAGTMLSIALFGLGFVPAFWNARRRALHDFIAGTVVVHAKATPETIAAAQPPSLSTLASIGKTALFVLAVAVPVYFHEGVMHGREARRINEVNFAQTAPVVAALDAYKQKNGRYPESLAALHPQYLAALPKLEISALNYSTSAAGDNCWIAIVFWMRAGFLPSDDANEYECASRRWKLADFNDLKARHAESWREQSKGR
jgi:uncharacterized RDD family membrane protein YckC